jgi:catechol 2,3-dioxygenase-like lactoylglutathione lyase family enzyme
VKDLGLTHIALEVTNLSQSIAFYQKYAGLKVVHRRTDAETKIEVAWMSDLIRPFAIVLLQMPQINGKLLPQAHLGVALKNREEVDRLCQQASEEGILLSGPNDWGSPVGYWAYLQDPNGHTLELSFGQEIHLTLAEASESLPEIKPINNA